MYVEEKYYNILKAKRDDNLDDIRKKYIALAMKYEGSNNKEFERINNAWVKISQFHEEKINRVKKSDDDSDFFKDELLEMIEIDKKRISKSSYAILKEKVKNNQISKKQLDDELTKEYLLNMIDKNSNGHHRYKLLKEKVKNNQITTEDELNDELSKIKIILDRTSNNTYNTNNAKKNNKIKYSANKTRNNISKKNKFIIIGLIIIIFFLSVCLLYVTHVFTDDDLTFMDGHYNITVGNPKNYEKYDVLIEGHGNAMKIKTNTNATHEINYYNVTLSNGDWYILVLANGSTKDYHFIEDFNYQNGKYIFHYSKSGSYRDSQAYIDEASNSKFLTEDFLKSIIGSYYGN